MMYKCKKKKVRIQEISKLKFGLEYFLMNLSLNFFIKKDGIRKTEKPLRVNIAAISVVGEYPIFQINLRFVYIYNVNRNSEDVNLFKNRN